MHLLPPLTRRSKRSMHEGISGQIEFLGPDHIHRHGALTPTDITLGGLHTVDIKWLVWEGLAPSSERERICYFAHDRSVWWVKVRCQRLPPPAREIRAWFEHERDDGRDRHTGETMCFLDWQGNKWIATIQTVREPFPAAPRFHLTRDVHKDA